MIRRALALTLTLGTVVMLASPAAALAAGGTIVRLDGSADVERGGHRIPVAKSSALYSGDVLNVSGDSVAQVRFEDDSVFVVPGPAKFRVEEFTMPGARGPGKAIYTLMEGGLRTITGSVKGSRGQYEMRTDEATITVDGSSYSAMRCSGACARKHSPGLYVKGESGTITVTGKGGQVKLRPGQIAFVPAGGGAPDYVKNSPFTDPELVSTFGAQVQLDVDVHPPRIEPENPASPS